MYKAKLTQGHLQSPSKFHLSWPELNKDPSDIRSLYAATKSHASKFRTSALKKLDNLCAEKHHPFITSLMMNGQSQEAHNWERL
jgi:hypothetical protein